MIKSVRLKLFLYFTIFLTFFVFLSTFMNIKFFDKYFFYRNESIFYNAYERINELNLNETESLQSTLRNVTSTMYVKSTVYEKETLAVKADSEAHHNKDHIHLMTIDLINKRIDDIRNGHIYEIVQPPPPGANYNNSVKSVPRKGRDVDFQAPSGQGVRELIFIKALDTGDFLVLRKPLHVIIDNSKITSEFLIYVGAITILLGSIFVFFFSKQITKPIIELSHIAQSISNLNFSKKYKVKTQDEIGILGDSINLISEELHKALDELVSANAELKEDNDRKKEIDEMRKSFISNVSHELKSPIGITKGYAEGLKYSIVNTEEKKRRYYDMLIDEAEKMDKMVKQLLSLSNLESEAFELEESVFNISILIEEVIEKFDLTLKEKGIEAKITIDNDYFIKADYLKIEQVIINYLTNALNHVDGHKHIEIKTQLIDEKVRTSIINSGNNIPQEDLERIWDSFYKVDKARSREYGGTGLGLSIVKSIMEHHTGGYGVENTDFGVEFWFELNILGEASF